MRTAFWTLTLKVMKRLAICCAIFALFFGTYGPAPAAIRPAAQTVEEGTAASALRMLLTRCLPHVVVGGAPRTSGLEQAGETFSRAMLDGRRGSVWANWDRETVMIAYAAMPVCRVVALTIDPDDLAGKVVKVFSSSTTIFRRQRFRNDVFGSFAAVYTGNADGVEIILRISISERSDGASFATLSVERSL